MKTWIVMGYPRDRAGSGHAPHFIKAWETNSSFPILRNTTNIDEAKIYHFKDIAKEARDAARNGFPECNWDVYRVKCVPRLTKKARKQAGMRK